VFHTSNHTPVLDNASAGRYRPSDSLVVVNVTLEPDDRDFVTDEGFVDDSSDLGTRSKYCNDFDLPKNTE